MMALLLMGLVVGGGLLGLVLYYSEGARLKRELRNAERWSIGEFPDGTIAKVVGSLVLVGEPLMAPLSGRPCAYYDIRVQEYRSSGKSGSWHTIIRESQGTDFMLEDGTGKAIIVVG